MTDDQRIVVTGLGVVSALGHNLADTWNGLIAGRSGVETIHLFDPHRLDVRIAAQVPDLGTRPIHAQKRSPAHGPLQPVRRRRRPRSRPARRPLPLRGLRARRRDGRHRHRRHHHHRSPVPRPRPPRARPRLTLRRAHDAAQHGQRTGQHRTRRARPQPRPHLRLLQRRRRARPRRRNHPPRRRRHHARRRRRSPHLRNGRRRLHCRARPLRPQ